MRIANKIKEEYLVQKKLYAEMKVAQNDTMNRIEYVLSLSEDYSQ